MKRKLLILLLKIMPGKSLLRKYLAAKFQKEKPSDPMHWIIRLDMLTVLASYKGPVDVVITGDSVVAAVKPWTDSQIKGSTNTAFVGATPLTLKENLEWMVKVFNPKKVRYQIGGNAVLSDQPDDVTIDQIIGVGQAIEGMCEDSKFMGIVPVRDQEINKHTWAIMHAVERSGIRCDYRLRGELADETGALRADLAAPDGIHEVPLAGPIWVGAIEASL